MKIRRIEFDDLPIRVAWMNDPRVYNSMNFDVPVALDRTIQWYNVVIRNENRIDYVLLDDDDNRVAMGGITGIESDLLFGELYIFVNPNLHGQGIGKESSMMICNQIFKDKKLNAIYLFANKTNLSALAIYKKIGFVEDIPPSFIEDRLSESRVYLEMYRNQ